MSLRKDELLMIQGTDYRAMTLQLLERTGAEQLIPNRHTLIGIKPNLLGPIPASEGATTHTEVVEGIIDYLHAAGFDNLVMLESSWVGDRTKDSLLVTGFDALAERTGVPFWDLQEDRGVPLDCAGMEIEVCERALQIGFLINVPVLKGHCQTGVTCALKNMKGLIPAASKRRFHRMGLHEPIGHLSAGLKQDLVIVDHICGDLVSEDGGSPVQCGRLLAGQDPVMIDAFAAAVVGLDIESVPYIGIAQALGLGSADLSRVHFEMADETHGWHPADLSVLKAGYAGQRQMADRMAIKEMAQEVDSCSACYAALVPAMERLAREGLLTSLPGKVCIGQGFQGKTGQIGVGRCTAGFDAHIGGCPPSEEQIYDFLKALVTFH